MSQQSPLGAPPAHRHAVSVGRLWQRLVDGLAVLGTLMIVALMLVIFADVVARNLTGGSLPLVTELGALMLVMIVYLQLGTTVRHDRLARTDLFYSMFRQRYPRTGALLAAVFDLVGCAACALIAFATLGILGKDIAHHDFIGVTGVVTFPTWPFRTLILIGVAVSTLQFLIHAVAAGRIALRGPEANP